MTVIFYIPEKATNDATSYFVDLVRRTCTDNAITTSLETNNTFNVRESDYVFTIRIRDFVNVYRRFPKVKNIFWSQGIGPEEYLMINNYSFKSKIISWAFNVLEKFTLKKSFYIFMVSDAMKNHYEKKHHIKINNYSIIPCYNKHLQKHCFKSELKQPNSFVFAGSLYAWQCFEKTITIFKNIENDNPNSSLTVLTKDIKLAAEILKSHNIKNFKVRYVPLSELDDTLSTYKYGFILRDDHIINNVATPTKMNTYLSVGLIPIYTDVIHSFEKNLSLDTFQVKVSANMSDHNISDAILSHNLLEVDYDKFYNICVNNYDGYYDDEFNSTLILNDLLSKIKVF